MSDPRRRQELLERIPLRRIGEAQDIGPLVVFLAGDESNMITGEVIFIDGGANAA